MTKHWVRLLLLAGLLPALLGSTAGRWRSVAEQDIAFARALAADGIRFDAPFQSRLIEGRLAGCSPRPSKIRDLSPTELRMLDDYGVHVCAPWHQTWAGISSACDGIWVPRWCKSGDESAIVEHVGFAPYFETLTAAVRSAGDPLVRSNIMEVLGDLLNADVLRHHPAAALDAWVSGVVAAYLEQATSDEVVRIAEPILGATFGHGPRVAGQFVTIRDRSGAMTPDQKCAMTAILKREDRWVCGGYSGGARQAEDAAAAARSSLEARVLTAQNLRLLLLRIDAYYRLEKDEDCNGTYDFLAFDLREGGYDREGWIRTCRRLNKGLAVIDWQVHRAVAVGNQVRVDTLVRYLERTGARKGQVWPREWEDYWVFEEGTWNYRLGMLPEEWNGMAETEVPLPGGPSQNDPE